MISLAKGQKVSLSKEAPTLQKMVVGLGWDINVKKGLFGGKDYDLDAFVVALRNGRFSSRDDLTYYGHLDGCGGAVHHCGDNLTGAGEGDDEQIVIDLSRLPADVDKLVVGVNIYQAKQRKQDFGKVKNAFVRVCDQSNGAEILRFSLTEDYSGMIGMIFGEVYRHNSEWKFNPIGSGVKEETIEAIARMYA